LVIKRGRAAAIGRKLRRPIEAAAGKMRALQIEPGEGANRMRRC